RLFFSLPTEVAASCVNPPRRGAPLNRNEEFRDKERSAEAPQPSAPRPRLGRSRRSGYPRQERLFPSARADFETVARSGPRFVRMARATSRRRLNDGAASLGVRHPHPALWGLDGSP